ncbi:protein O-mannosyl-transferase family [Sandaracinus amylolyticus]|uniref:protein O-mannosyl-transferase family n=1 Tax=Sandaracinus amylolyticus TaxID=927083 RepID=UPI001F1B58B2|nr:DUF2723 domain-containing protein [Sandaracinus amylolyticus]UJR86129.1 Hypothetical protein I5071_82100 [Sandaracinus amylolyticus]
MALIPKHPRDPSVSLIAYALAVGVPFAAYLATASPHAYWLDSGELAAAAVALDIAHPPGHPLAALVGHLFTFLPLGPLALRIALAQALCGAVAAGFLFRAIDTTVRAMEVRHDRLSIPIALGATWSVACSYAWWFQSVRPEVYALQALLLAIAIERIVALEASWPTHDVRPLSVAALALGLALANHHFMAVMTLPAIAPTLARVYRARGPRSLVVAAGALAAGLAAYVYLPVRSSTDPPVDLGHPTDLSRFFWVVSARAYQHTNVLEDAGPIDRAIDVMIAIVETVHPLLLVLALAGLWALLRAPGARRLGWVWAAIVLFACLGRTWLGHTAGNPDALGYLLPAFMGIAALAAAFVGALMAQLGGGSARAPRTMLTVLALVTAALGLAQLDQSRAHASLATFHATDDFDDRRIRALPPRAVVIAHLPQTVFRHWELAQTEHARPDVTLVPIPFLGYPGVVDHLVERDPSLRELLSGYLVDGELRQPNLQSLAASRPLLIEMDVRVPRALYETIVPGPGFYEVVDGGATDADVRGGAARRAASLESLARALGPRQDDPETRNQLLWAHYVDALYYAQVGVLERARESVSRALAIQPEALELRALSQRLAEADGETPIDVSDFTVGP